MLNRVSGLVPAKGDISRTVGQQPATSGRTLYAAEWRFLVREPPLRGLPLGSKPAHFGLDSRI